MWSDDAMWGWEENGDFYEYNYNGSGSDRYVNMFEQELGHEDKAIAREQRRERQERLREQHKTHRHLAILRCNQQIYSEAYHILYSELTMTLHPDYVRCMGADENHLDIKMSEIWRHNPKQGFSAKDHTDGVISYEGVENSGSMEPHVFTRFSKIKIDANFVFEEDDKAPILYIDENLHLEPESEELLTEFFATLTIFNLLTDILSHTLRIKNLTVALDLQMTILDRRDDDGLEGSDYDHEQETKEELAGSVRAMELFLDSGILAPLRQLSNVQCFAVDFNLPAYTAVNVHPSDGAPIEYYKPQGQRAKLLQDMKAQIESNWTDKHRPLA